MSVRRGDMAPESPGEAAPAESSRGEAPQAQSSRNDGSLAQAAGPRPGSRFALLRGRMALSAAVEALAAVGIGTAVIAVLQSTAPPAGLGIVYLLSVLTVAIRRGLRAALGAAVLSVLVLNYLFIPPRHQLQIAHSQDVVELVVLLITAVVVGRLAATARDRAAEAESRAQVASARRREAALVADIAAGILAQERLPEQLAAVGRRIAGAAGAEGARIVFEPIATPAAGETAIVLPSRNGPAWLYVTDTPTADRQLVAQLARALGGLLDLAVERDRMASQAAEVEATRRADVAKTAILHAISHDLRSPLTAVRTAAAALGATGISASEQEELAASIEAESNRLGRLVEDLLDLSRIEAGAAAPQPEWCDLLDVVATAAQRFESQRTIELRLPARLPLVRADSGQIERVFANLIENALKFSPPGSPVEIRGSASTAWATVRVVDHGPGVALEDRQAIFEPFFRGRGVRTGGSGLGLAICRGLVEANGGRIILQADSGHGTSFAVRFPVAPTPDEDGESLAAASPTAQADATP